MRDDEPAKPAGPESELRQRIGAQEARKLAARRSAVKGIWFGFGMMGLIGWSVAVPALLGVSAGHWLDTRHPGSHSLTLALLIAGLGLGCFNAWHWVAKEERGIREDREGRGD